jgi:hypothetical protein
MTTGFVCALGPGILLFSMDFHAQTPANDGKAPDILSILPEWTSKSRKRTAAV